MHHRNSHEAAITSREAEQPLQTSSAGFYISSMKREQGLFNTSVCGHQSAFLCLCRSADVRVEVPGLAPFFPLDEPTPASSSNSSSGTASRRAAAAAAAGDEAAAGPSGRGSQDAAGPLLTLGENRRHSCGLYRVKTIRIQTVADLLVYSQCQSSIHSIRWCNSWSSMSVEVGGKRGTDGGRAS